MKILYLHQYFSTPDGSSGLRSYEFASALVKRGHDVTILCGSYDGSRTGLEQFPYVKGVRRGDVEGIHVVELSLVYSNLHSFMSRTLIFLRYALRAIFEACRKEYDVVFATSTPLTAAIPGIVAHIFARKKFIFEVRDLWPELPRAMGVIKNPVILGMMSLLEFAAYKSACRIIGLSPGIVKGIGRYGASAQHIAMIPNACDDKIFNPSKKSEIGIEGITKKDFTAVFSGTIGVANGAEAIIDAAEIVKRSGRSDIKVLLIGRGNRRESLKKRALEAGLDNCIFADPVSKENIARIIASADVGLMVLANVPAFYYGTSPNKFFDYIACGIPVINNYPGWLAEMITDNSCGIVVPPEDPQAFADALCKLADDRGAAQEMGGKSYMLSKKFIRSEMARQFCKVVESVMVLENNKQSVTSM